MTMTTCFSNKLPWLICLIAVLCCGGGCGSSKSDPMARAKMRRRLDPDPVQAKPEPQAAATSSDSDQTPQPKAAMPAVQVDPPAAPDTTASVKPTGDPPAPATRLPIAKRKPEQPLDEQQRRRRTAENLKKIGDAVIAYADRNGEFPSTAPIESEGGIKTLSWRVAILPFLGYDDLYQRFDPNEPWDGENNRKLLELIPDEYVSPDRFDTRTNYQGPAYRAFMFGIDRIGPGGIEDGAANTILLVEVDDEYAVEWTRPADYAAEPNSLRNGLGHLRGDGVIAVWANGMPTLLPNNASDQQFLKAFTHNASDGQKAGDIHRPVTVEQVDASVVQATIDQHADPRQAVPGQQPQSPAEFAPTTVRTPVPAATDLAQAANKLRAVFAPQLEKLPDAAQRAALAQQMIPQAVEMVEDPAGAYSLLSAATVLAVDMGDFSTAVEAVETKIRLFEVDAYEENVTMLLEFGKSHSGRRGGGGANDEYTSRAIRVISAGIQADDFSKASTIARYALAFKGEHGGDPTVAMLNRLRTQLSVAKGHYTRTSTALATLRSDPNNAHAAEEVGRFLCFIKGDWEAGLEQLAKSENGPLKEIAIADLNGAETPQAMLVLADAWWDLSERTTQGVFQQACRDRAVTWYQQAIEQLPESLDKLHAKARLDEAGEVQASSPLALVKRLADESNVDLTASLAGIVQPPRSR